MAEDARSERQLMRQRGAGDRELAPANFDFNFVADSREDRQLMRQRGAGTRQVDAVDFGFHFATPSTVRSQRFGLQSPGTATRQNEQIWKSPEHTTGFQSLLSAKSARGQGSRSVHGESPPKKRRRLSEISNMSRASSVPLPFAGYSHDTPAVVDPAEPAIQQQENVQSSPLFFPASKPDVPSIAGNENDSSMLSTTSKKSTKKRKRKSIGQQSTRNKKRRSKSSQPLPTPPETQDSSVQSIESTQEAVTENSSNSRPNRQSRRWSVDSREPDSTMSIKSSLSASKGMRPELNAALYQHPVEPEEVAHDIRVSEELASISEIPVDSIEIEETNRLDDESEVDELSFNLTTEVDTTEKDIAFDEQVAIPEPVKVNDRYASQEDDQLSDTSEPLQPQNLDVSHIDNDEEADEDYVPDRNPQTKAVKTKPSQQRQSKPRRFRSRSTESGRQRQKRKPGIPILTYRMTNIDKLPTINEAIHEDEEDSDANDFTRAPSAFTTRKSGNAVDVLRQACHEQIDVRIEEIQDSDLSRVDIKNCIVALQSFKTAIHTQLFQVSQALDHRVLLEKRLRESRKEKAALQARWLEIRRRRDLIALQTDAVRRTCWENKILDEKRFHTSQAAFALEHAVAREEEDENIDFTSALELRLRTLAKDVSSQAGGGILQDLKKFNALLEKLANNLS